MVTIATDAHQLLPPIGNHTELLSSISRLLLTGEQHGARPASLTSVKRRRSDGQLRPPSIPVVGTPDASDAPFNGPSAEPGPSAAADAEPDARLFHTDHHPALAGPAPGGLQGAAHTHLLLWPVDAPDRDLPLLNRRAFAGDAP